ncbi:MAG TPA: glycine oxidase ThiO [Solirubrobacteraceae bacterium]|nr:glycine oxidase ThiO [Solirubrobacteraceae bacterium]
MARRGRPVDVAVVGGGVIGLACAWRARRRGCSVLVLESHAIGERCASYVAAGMLAPISEVEFGEAGRRVLDLGLRSAGLWPEFAAELRGATGIDVGLRTGGTLVVARDADEARELERQLALRRQLGLRVRRLRPSEAREIEPGLASGVRLALEAPDDCSVDPRLVLRALRRACEAAGVTVREHAAVAEVELHRGDGGTGLDGDGGGPREVLLAGGERIAARNVVLAAGAWTGGIEGLPQEARAPVRPVRGQILRLRDPAGPGLLARVLRFEGGYLVPRDDGRYVLGATMEERDFEPRPTAGGVYELLRQARELLPGVLELELEEVSVGFRPATPDNAPLIGPAGVPGVLWATGHHRNGILLAPLTAALVAEALPATATVPA